MTLVRYQVFVSSTFRDLREERQAALDAILNMSHFPAGMELFPASDATPWNVIERVIDQSDYYVLIVGGMYGSTDTNGVSYTEREYDYAASVEKPILAFLHEDPATIPAGKVEMEPSARKALEAFRIKVQRHHCKFWKDSGDLRYKVAISLVQEINSNPAQGWVRAGDAGDRAQVQRARASERLAAQEAQQHARMRGEAEKRIRSMAEETASLREQVVEAEAVAEAAAKREAAAVDREQAARRELATLPRESEAVGTPAFDLMEFGRKNAKAFLLGEAGDPAETLRSLMVWEKTPQGHDFWSEECIRLEEGDPLSDEARMALQELVENAGG